MDKTNFKFPSLWKIVVLLIVIPISWLTIWFLLAVLGHQVGIPMPSVGDTAGFLGSIGSIMGAVFTVGGLIVALVAVLTQIQLQDRVKQEVDKAKLAIEDMFNNKLRVEYEKRIQEQVEGMLAYFQATGTPDLRQAEVLTREALRKYPSLPGIRSTFALKLSSLIKIHFSNLLYQSVIQKATSLATAMHLNQIQSTQVPSTIEAIDWLKEALVNHDDPEGQVSATLALMYGYGEAYDMMLVTLTKALADYPSLVPYFHSPHHFLMLIYSCQKNYTRIKEVINILRLPLPTEQDITATVTNRKPIPSAQFVDWYAVEKLPERNASKVPLKIRIFLVSSPDKPTYASIFKYEQQPYAIPPANASGTADYMETDKLIKKLFAEFIFICQDGL